LKKTYPDSRDAADYLRSQNIPARVSLEMADFENFFERRKDLLKRKLAEVLNVGLDTRPA
jgi:hypothetical protein